MKMALGMFTTAFSDFQVVVEEMIAERNRIASRGYFTGRHAGDFQGISPTGRPIKVGYVDIWHVDEQGKFVANWVQMDMLGLLQQLGVMPTSGQ
jgi:predicted ester cyclase